MRDLKASDFLYLKEVFAELRAQRQGNRPQIDECILMDHIDRLIEATEMSEAIARIELEILRDFKARLEGQTPDAGGVQ